MSEQSEHPSQLLREHLATIGMSASELALKSGLNRGRIWEILNRTRPFTIRTALALEKALPFVAAEEWVIAQAKWNIHEARKQPPVTSKLPRPDEAKREAPLLDYIEAYVK